MRGLSFAFIWAGVALFIWSSLRAVRRASPPVAEPI
jgi:EamA domain-containing membrane protein RarD